MDMESEEKVELIQLAIQRLMEEQREKKLLTSSDGSNLVGEDHHLLSELLSQLETLHGVDKPLQPEPPVDPEKAKSDAVNEVESVGGDDSGREEIIRELKKVQKQNFITHCLLSVMITLTVAWQLSEFALVFQVKNGLLSHPFRTIGSMFTSMIKGPVEKAQIVEKDSGTKQLQIEYPPIPPLKIPELPHLDLLLGSDNEEH
jgi:hypothetical protein